MSSGYNEQGISEPAKELHRALASVQEELEAIDYYHQRADRCGNEALKAILEHNRNEEMEHAAMLLEWIRRTSPEFAAAMKTYLFTEKPVTEIEAAGASESSPGSGGELGIGRNA